MKITIKDGATPRLKELAGGLTKRKPLHAAMGKRGEIELRAHFAARDLEPNAKGWPKQHFWGQMRRATAYLSADANGAVVVIADKRINQRIFGGTLKPRETKFMAIPAIAEAYGHRPGEFDFLKIHRFRSGALALVETDRTIVRFGRTRRDGTRKTTVVGRSRRGRVWYWLARSVKQDKDPQALPPERIFTEAMLAEVDAYVTRLLARQQ